MKKVISTFAILSILFFVSNVTTAQDNQSDYDKQKLNTPYVPDNTPKTPVDPNSSQSIPFIANSQTDSIGGLLEPLDTTTFTIAPFVGAAPPQYRNDDLSTALIPFPTGCEFCLYGTIYTGCYINNNGNLTFTGPFGTFTPTGFPITTAMVAPFWADVDTRLGASPPNSGLVYYKFTTGTGSGLGWRMTVIWDKVGYFAVQNDKQNEFEVIISNGQDPLLGIGNNVAFSYVNMAWTTGSASGGINGFGGSPATVGVNKGDNVTFSTLGRFNRPGNYYGGPTVDTNGVSYLDKLTLAFAVCDASNFCPIPGGFPTNDTVLISCGSTYNHTFTFAAPELGQTVTSSVSGAPAGFSTVIVNGTLSTIDVTWPTNCNTDCGDHVVCFTGIDNFTPPCTVTVCVHFIVDCPLPVELSAFTSFVNNRDVTLNWTTITETNNSGFDIERSSGNNEWNKVGNVTGNGNSTTSHSYTFTDRGLSSGSYNYRLKQIDFNGNYEYHNLSNLVNIGTPEKFNLMQNYPNPFNPTTKIEYALPKDGFVTLSIFDNSGKEVSKLVNGNMTTGYHTVDFNGANLASGIYFYRLEVKGSDNNFVTVKKMILLK